MVESYIGERVVLGDQASRGGCGLVVDYCIGESGEWWKWVALEETGELGDGTLLGLVNNKKITPLIFILMLSVIDVYTSPCF